VSLSLYELEREEKLKIDDLSKVWHEPLREIGAVVHLLDETVKEHFEELDVTVILSGKGHVYELKRDKNGKVKLYEL